MEGKNVFARFVVDMDPDLRPMDEAMVVNSRDELLAIGQVILIRDEALAFDRGIAVKVREGCGKKRTLQDPPESEGENGRKEN